MKINDIITEATDQFEFDLDNDQGRLHVYDQSGGPAGRIEFYTPDDSNPNTIDISMIIVRPQYQRQGLASAMYRYLEKQGYKILTPTELTPDGKKFFSNKKQEGVVDEMAAAGNFGNRMWYHGTTKRVLNKILQTRVVKPFVADQSEPGAAIWLTSDLEQALDYGNVVLAIPNSIVRNYNIERWSGFPHGAMKKHNLKAETYNMVIKDAVPLKYWKLVDPKTGNLVNIPKPAVADVSRDDDEYGPKAREEWLKKQAYEKEYNKKNPPTPVKPVNKKKDQGVGENFADGRNPQDKGDSKRHGVPTKASVSTLRKVAKQGGRKGQLAHWMANMKAGKAKNK